MDNPLHAAAVACGRRRAQTSGEDLVMVVVHAQARPLPPHECTVVRGHTMLTRKPRLDYR